MKKKLLSLLVVVALVLSAVVCLTACEKIDLGHGATKITVWVSETEGVKSLTQKQIAAWLDTKEGYRDLYTIDVQGQTESESATKMVEDVESGADIYCFAQDQLARLIEAKALDILNDTAKQFVTSKNDAGAVKAATVNNSVYCYPITSDNGYFMYYDKSVVKAEHLNDLAAIVQDCKDAGKNFSFELGGSAWYTASFFFGVGCTSEWRLDDNTNKWVVADDFDSEQGLIAMKGMQILTASGIWNDSSKAADFEAAIPSAVVVSGTWDSGKAKEALGANYAVAKLPKFTVDGQDYQLGSYSGNKLMGVKPSADAAKKAVCHEIAQLLSDQAAQEARFDLVGWGPSNKNVQALDKVKNDAALNALAAQNEFATPQGQIFGGWWDVAKLLGSKTVDADKHAVNEATLKAAQEAYRAELDRFTRLTVDDLAAYGVVGSIGSMAGDTEHLAATQEEWSDWGTDVKMTKTENADGTTTWKTVIAVALTEGDMFKVRQGQSWDVQWGSVNTDADGKAIEPAKFAADTATAVKGKNGDDEGSNIQVEAAGTYYIVLTISADGKTATVTLETAAQ